MAALSFSIMVFSEYMPCSEIAVLYGSFIPSFLRNLHTILHRGSINLYPYKQCRRLPFPQHLFVDFFDGGHQKNGHQDGCCSFHFQWNEQQPS